MCCYGSDVVGKYAPKWLFVARMERFRRETQQDWQNSFKTPRFRTVLRRR